MGLVEARYGWDSIAQLLMDVYEEMVATPKAVAAQNTDAYV